jgi:hypothetical protein
MMMGGLAEALDHVNEMLERRGDSGFGDDLGLVAERFHLDLEPGVGRRDDLIPLRPVVLHPAVPAAGGHPQAVNEHDRRRTGR